MKARGVKRLEAEVDEWAAETELLLGTCQRLIAYFGTAKELKSWERAIEAPLALVPVVVACLSSNARGERSLPPYSPGVAFRCSESTARVVSPLAEIVGGPVADFVYTIRRIVPRAEQSRYILPYGSFSVSFAEAVTYPLWTTYRQLAPEQWKAVFPARPASRGSRRPAVARRR